jgi:GAF domain-containing protein
LRDVLVPYFRAGLENNELCLWVTDAPFCLDDARAALRAAVPDLDVRERRGQIEIQDTRSFYDPDQPLQSKAIVDGLVQREQKALAAYCNHYAPSMFGFQSYISMPIFMRDGRFYGTLCAIDPEPAKLGDPVVIGMFRRFADLIAFQLEAATRLATAEANLAEAIARKKLQE